MQSVQSRAAVAHLVHGLGRGRRTQRFLDHHDDYVIQGVLEVHPGAAFSTNWCLATIFEWVTADGEHFNARIAKTCKSNIHIDVNSPDSQQAVTEHRWLTGMVKFSVCYGPVNDTNTTPSYCNDYPYASRTVYRDESITGYATGPNASVPNLCARSWRVDVGGTSVPYNAGGIPTACNS